ncbi:MAG: Multicopper oxidase [Rhodanobacteraceae bacterium]|jgi:FtsP/CotA-like multicopper oxidase with cupredoxin domain|nr:MAG: Multicopper oxidase [Rhodanobacteraceae bacterium]
MTLDLRNTKTGYGYVPVLLLLLLCAAGLMPRTSLAATAPPAAGACGPVAPSPVLVEPQAVDMRDAPINASGEHELILAVHMDEGGNRFCYVYRWLGVVHTTAPAIHVRRGERFAIRIVNDIASQSLGESVPSTAIPACKPMAMLDAPVQHWVGYLNHTIDDRDFEMKPLDTNLHLHGYEGPASDENVFLSTLSTPMHACEYRITIPRSQPPGTYIFHPHAHGAADAELGGGLAGVWIVEPDSQQLPRADQHVLLLAYQMGEPDDGPSPSPAKRLAYGNAATAHEAALKRAPSVPYDPFNPPPWPSAAPLRAGGIVLNGCSGLFAESLISIDGANAPSTLPIRAGRTQLLRIVNGTADSPKLLHLRDALGHTLPFELVERDGVPVSGDTQHPYARYLPLQELMLSPMSRAAILLTVPAGGSFELSSEPWCEGIVRETHHDLLRITATADAGNNPQLLRPTPIKVSDTPAARLVAWVQAHPTLVHRRAITFTQYEFPKQGKIPPHPAFYITDTTNPNFHEHPFWPDFGPDATVPSNPDIVVKQGTVEVWYLINTTLENHNFHIHQMKFVQERNYSGIPMMVDTVFQPLGKMLPNPRDPDYPLIQPAITRVILDFRDVPKGTFVFHCHMLFHEDHGMMGSIRVE